MNPEDILNIFDVILKEHSPSITSISFSYNPYFGDEGVIIFVKNLPLSIQKIGLVDCGLSNKGGSALLKWIKQAPNLKMICIEQNNFSQKLKAEFHMFAKDNPNILLVI